MKRIATAAVDVRRPLTRVEFALLAVAVCGLSFIATLQLLERLT